MNILVIVNHFDAPAGLLGQRISAHGGRYDAFNPHCRYGSVDPAAPMDMPADDAGYDGLAVLGGYQDAWDDAGYPAFRATLDLIRRFHDGEKPILGLCLGAQLMARAFGAEVRRMGGFERGVIEVIRCDRGARDPLLPVGGEAHRVASWHQDTFDLPEGARLLLSSADCAHQAFVVGRASYGFQCHLEATLDIVRTWMMRERERRPDGDPEIVRAMEAQLAAHFPAAARFGSETIDRWLALVDTRG